MDTKKKQKHRKWQPTHHLRYIRIDGDLKGLTFTQDEYGNFYKLQQKWISLLSNEEEWRDVKIEE
jgi:hypothetical protein